MRCAWCPYLTFVYHQEMAPIQNPKSSPGAISRSTFLPPPFLSADVPAQFQTSYCPYRS